MSKSKPFLGERTFKKVNAVYKGTNPDSYTAAYELYIEATDDLNEAAVVTSATANSYYHQPVIDVDVPVYLVPSSTHGHSHLYFDVPPVEWPKYVKLLEALAECGIIEQGYLGVSLQKGYTAVRLPWVHREVPRD